MEVVIAEDWGTIEYGKAWDKQETLLGTALEAKRHYNSLPVEDRYGNPDTTHRFILCHHPHVYTLGKSGHMANLLLNDARLQSLGVSFYQTNRGGDITYHGPGQIVGYPLLDLEKFRTDLGWYMRSLEEVIIRTIAYYGIVGDRLPGSTGVWLDVDTPSRARKICAMGVRCSRWVTMHGFALNVNTDLGYFSHIIPCGILDKGVTSIAAELGTKVEEEEVKELLHSAFRDVFNVQIVTETHNTIPVPF